MSTYTPIASQTLSANAASVTFSSVPQEYTDLVIIIKGQGTSNIAITTTFNNDTATNYSRAYFYADGSGQASGRVQNETGVIFSFNAARGHTIMHINGYSNSVGFKNALISNDYYDNATVRTSGVWRNTAPITSIKFSGTDIASGTVISLYGLAGGQVGAKATGGIITTSGAYTIHTFLTSSAFTPNEDLTVDYLVVAGGGASSTINNSGGGGGGGMRCTVTATGGSGSLESALSLSSGVSYPVIVGAGGAYSITGYNSGSNSVFGSIVSVGGGGAGSGMDNIAGGTGGSGGGAGVTVSSGSNYGGTNVTSQGYAGGDATRGVSAYGAGGGGGAGAVGDNGSGSSAGAGGNGRATSISGSSVTYAGGGGGGHNSASPVSGGSGGGGAGGRSGASAGAGSANTGGGGGGGGNANTPGNGLGQAGGSGIVIIRYTS